MAGKSGWDSPIPQHKLEWHNYNSRLNEFN